jgi:hypothetical protein
MLLADIFVSSVKPSSSVVLARNFRFVDSVNQIEGFFARMLACEGGVVARMEVAGS